jgi:hypothetical protein
MMIKKLLETRVRGAMADLGERVTKVAVAPPGGAIQKRQNVANELKPICALVEEMLEIAKRSYGVALTASHMGHIAYEHNVLILDLSPAKTPTYLKRVVKEKWDEVHRLKKRRVRWTIGGDRIVVGYDVGTNTAALPTVNALFLPLSPLTPAWPPST